jgi:hypothetical protein
MGSHLHCLFQQPVKLSAAVRSLKKTHAQDVERFQGLVQLCKFSCGKFTGQGLGKMQGQSTLKISYEAP